MKSKQLIMTPEDWHEFGMDLGDAIRHLVDGDAEYFFDWANYYLPEVEDAPND